MLTDQQKQNMQKALERVTLEKERELADRGLSQDGITAYIEGFQDQFRVGFVIGSIESICGLVKSKEEGMDIPDDLIKEMFGCEPYEAKAIYEICRRQKMIGR